MKIDKIFCDECGGEIVLCECMENQRRFSLDETMDDGKTYDFCGAECLKKFVAKKEFENKFYRWREIEEKRRSKRTKR